MALQKIFGSRRESGDDHWITVSDLMAGLMVIFLFIAITHVRNVEKASASGFASDPNLEIQKLTAELVVAKAKLAEATKPTLSLDDLKSELEAEKSIAQHLQKVFEEDLVRLNDGLAAEEALARQLRAAFQKDLAKWNAEIEQERFVIRFREEGMTFKPRSAELSDGFRAALAEFFPRYLSILNNHKSAVNEVRIEGHSSSEWHGTVGKDEAFFKNMELSQARARAVLEYGLSTLQSAEFRDWARKNITANGLSSSRPILQSGTENPALSRRVEFRIQTNTRQTGLDVLKKIKRGPISEEAAAAN